MEYVPKGNTLITVEWKYPEKKEAQGRRKNEKEAKREIMQAAYTEYSLTPSL